MSRRFRRWLILIVTLVALRAVLPFGVREWLEAKLPVWTGARVEIGDVDLWLLLGGVRFKDVVVLSRAEKAEPAMRLRSFYVRAHWLPLLQGRIHLEEIEVESPSFGIERREGGGVGIVGLQAGGTPPAPTPAPESAEEGELPDVRVDRIVLVSGESSFRDKTQPTAGRLEVDVQSLRIERVALSESGYDQPMQMSLEGVVGRDGTVQVSGTFDRKESEFRIDGTVQTHHLPVGRLVGFLPGRPRWQSVAGSLGTDLRYRWHSGSEHFVAGKVNLDDLRVRKEGFDEAILGWDNVEVTIDRVDLLDQRVTLASVRMDGADVTLVPTATEPVPVVATGTALPQETTIPTATPGSDPASVPSPPGGEGQGEGDAPGSESPGTTPTPASARQPTSGSNPSSSPTPTPVPSPQGGDGEGDGDGDGEGEGGVSASEEPPATPERPSWSIDLGSAEVRSSRLRLLGPGEASVEIAVDGRAERSDQEPSRYSVELDLAEGEGTFHMQGDVDAGDGAFDGALEWTKLHVARLAKVFPAGAVDVRDGTTTGRLDVGARLVPEPGTAARVRGSGHVGMTSLRIATAEKPVFRFIIADGSLEADSVDIAILDGGPQIRASEVRLSGGQTTLVDEAVSPPFELTLESTKGHARKVSFPPLTTPEVELHAATTRDGSLDLKGQVTTEKVSFEVTGNRIALQRFNAYVREFSGYAIREGTTSVHARVEFLKERIGISNSITIHGLSLGGDSARLFRKQFGLPLSLALGLMRSSGGDINLDVSFETGREGTRVDFFGIIGSVLQQAILSAVTSPLKLLGVVKLIGDKITNVSLEPIRFRPGTAEPSNDGRNMVEKLGKFLTGHPAMRITLTGQVAEVDVRRMKERALLDKLQEQEPPEEGDERPRARIRLYLKKKLGGEDANLPKAERQMLETLLEGRDVPASDFTGLANRRAATVKRLLVEERGVPPDQVEALERESAETGAPAVRFDLEVAE